MRTTLTLLLIATSIISVRAQKLPDIQTTNIQAPQGLRIDGKLSEWNDVFAAENKRTALYYTLANDDKNIYLALKSTSQSAIAKIMLGGISLTLNTKGKKKDEESFTVTYPLVARNTGNRAAGGQNRQRGMQANNEQTQQQKDSTAMVQRKTQLAAIKEIKVSGFKDVNDSLISIYNEYGIKAVGKIDEQGAYCYELAIPLSMLEILPDFSKEIAYRIRLNGRPTAANFPARANNGGGGGFGAQNRQAGFGGSNNTAQQDLLSVTDFWGKYSFKK